MGWIQSFLQTFKKQDEFEETTIHNELESEKAYTPNQSTVGDGNKKGEARIAYHYPKGQFRFPLIPDESAQTLPSRKPREKQRERNPIVPTPKKEESTIIKNETPKRKIPIEENIKRERVLPKPVKKVRPFQPTEIPSPVYGFERPKVAKPVEHELSDFTPDPNVQVEELISYQNQVAGSEIWNTPPNTESFHEVESKVTQEDKLPPALEAENTSIPIFTELKLEDYETTKLTPLEAVGETVYIQEVDKHESQVKIEETIQSDLEQVTNDAVSLDSKNQETELVAAATVIHEDDPEVGNIIKVQEEISDIEIEVEDEKIEAIVELEEVEIIDDEVVITGTDFHEENSVESTVLNKEEERPVVVENEPARRHLPFNVLMLKQDKRKLEEKMRFQSAVSNPIHRVNEIQRLVAQDNQVNETQPPDTQVNQVNETQPPDTQVNQVNETQPPDTQVNQVNETQSPVGQQNQQLEQTIISVETRQTFETVETSEPQYYVVPGTELLNPPVFENADSDWLINQEMQLNQTLLNFNVGAKVVNVTQGPAVTRFEVQPEPGVKVNKITNLTDDIKLSLAARDIRIEAPIPGKHTIGIEVPNPSSRPVMISEIINTELFKENQSPLTAVLGLDISGAPIVTDLKKMPHGLIAGATGSGKSVCINSILVSLLYKASPEDLKLLLIDPKMVELAPYNQIPHLVSPVITDVKAATAALKWAVEEMERRYELFAHTGVRDINRFNELAMKHQRYSDKLPFIVIIIDELADLMMMSPADVEEAICRIAQKARACGIHLIVATQRPSVDVITGLIKANIPTRVAFSVSSQIDSRTIIDIGGAEKLLGRGDMLFLENGSSKAVRLQGTFVTDEEIDKVVAHVRRERAPEYLFEQEELLKRAQVTEEEDELFYEACEFVVDQGGASTSSLQRRFKVGYNRAARLIDMMEDHGYISGAKGSKPRDVLITAAELESLQESSTI
ncbi:MULTISPECIES: DNA translocase FtsK [unclassified Bacillus (in: firmicutes)]|uniref:DNA translocase FtsK n=1 Tax=unclassified Bacillus (in: firmicutes) TaxID=185979 RepID=UPI0008E738E6|nr:MULTISPECIES: DNA translocase FtsK [unclassified Bacillus (in: firmicutes)]SFB17845.1 DNA segregation ATPase FtsK/SpoIIIE, S-DNA-T family [Bacillus sp. UNCCL13]SFQ76569.1 DNA translocase FtsK [Bacillus sp. cl95]